MSRSDRPGVRGVRRIVYSLVPLVLLALVLEIGGRCVFYQQRSEHGLAVIGMVQALFDLRQEAENERVRLELTAKREAEEVDRQAYLRRYSEIFGRFVAACREADATLVVVFVPAANAASLRDREFFAGLAEQHDLPFFDLFEPLKNYSFELTYLIPEDGHFSRLGNRVVAAALAQYLQPMLGHRTTVSHDERPAILGDLRPSDDYVHWKGAPLPCRVVTNSQGLRRESDVEFPRGDSPRILCVGDSFTFGASVHNPHAFPQMLEKAMGDVEVINAGVSGYTICDEYSYFVERGRFLEPDLVLLQVFTNDVDGMSAALQSTFCRGGPYCPGVGEGR